MFRNAAIKIRTAQLLVHGWGKPNLCFPLSLIMASRNGAKSNSTGRAWARTFFFTPQLHVLCFCRPFMSHQVVTLTYNLLKAGPVCVRLTLKNLDRSSTPHLPSLASAMSGSLLCHVVLTFSLVGVCVCCCCCFKYADETGNEKTTSFNGCER